MNSTLKPTNDPISFERLIRLKNRTLRLFLGVLVVTSSMNVMTDSARAANPTSITGGGSTFAAPLYLKWAQDYRSIDSSVEINYQATGSGAGVRQFIAGTTFFGASDDPMKDEEIRQVKGPMIQFPVAIGGVVITYNIEGVKKPLKFTPELIGDIFLGKITKWNDPQIQKLNADVKLPQQAIVVTFRADGSGTTSIFTEYLSSHSTQWKTQVGQGKSVKFPLGLGGKGNEGVMGLVRQNPGAIGYVEMTFALVNQLPVGWIKNKSGQFIEPTVQSLTESSSKLKKKAIPQDFRISLLDSPNPKSYPLSSFTYVLVRQNMDPERGTKLLGFLRWALRDGKKSALELHYGVLPQEVQDKSLQLLSTVKLDTMKPDATPPSAP